MNNPVLPHPPEEDPPGCFLLIISLVAAFAAGALTATLFMTASGSMRAESSSHVEP